MATTKEIRNPEGGFPLESGQRWERLREAIEYLQSLDPHHLHPEDYSEIERAILKVWVRAKIRDELGSHLRYLASDVQQCLSDLHCSIEDTRRYVIRDRCIEPRRGARGIACSRYFRPLCDSEE